MNPRTVLAATALVAALGGRAAAAEEEAAERNIHVYVSVSKCQSVTDSNRTSAYEAGESWTVRPSDFVDGSLTKVDESENGKIIVNMGLNGEKLGIRARYIPKQGAQVNAGLFTSLGGGYAVARASMCETPEDVGDLQLDISLASKN